MTNLFLDIGKTRMVLAVLPLGEFPKVEVISFPGVLGSISQDEVCTQVVRGINKLRVDTGKRLGQVWVSLGAGELQVRRVKELTMLSAKTRKELKATYLNRLRLGLIRKVLRSGLYYITEEFSGLDIDGIIYPSLPADESIRCHSVAWQSFVIGIDRSKLAFLHQVLRQAKCRIRGIVCRELMMSKMVFSNTEKQNGALFVDIGAKDTVIIFYERGRLYAFKQLPFGGQDVTSSIMKEFGLPFWVAEEVKRRYIDIDVVAKHQPIIRIDGTNRIYEVDATQLCRVVMNCISKIFEKIKSEIYTWDVFLDKAVCALTGGICIMDGVIEMAERILDMPVRMAYCKNQSCVKLPPAYGPYSVLVGAFWQWIEQGGYERSWQEKVQIWLQDLWEFF